MSEFYRTQREVDTVFALAVYVYEGAGHNDRPQVAAALQGFRGVWPRLSPEQQAQVIAYDRGAHTHQQVALRRMLAEVNAV